MANLSTSINGTDIKVYNGYNSRLVAYSQNATLNVNMGLSERGNTDSYAWYNAIEGNRSWDVSVEGAYAWVDDFGNALYDGADDILERRILDRTLCFIVFGNTSTYYPTSHNHSWGGQAWLTNVSISAPNEDTATYSLTLEGFGFLRKINPK